MAIWPHRHWQFGTHVVLLQNFCIIRALKPPTLFYLFLATIFNHSQTLPIKKKPRKKESNHRQTSHCQPVIRLNLLINQPLNSQLKRIPWL